MNEVGFKPKAIGGAMVGLQATAIKAQLGPLLNGFIYYEFWLPCQRCNSRASPISFRVIKQERRKQKSIRWDIYMAPWAYAQLQVLQQAVEATKTLADAKLADYLREHSFSTVVGTVKFGAKGEWAQSRVLQVQYQTIKEHDID